MILLVDSGSTKSDWLLVEKNGDVVTSFKTMGFNPFFHDSDFIRIELSGNADLLAIADSVTDLYYYGAGCSSTHYREVVHRALTALFPGAEVVVDHDMMAAVYATSGGKPCISCILGTGSNAAYYDGKELHTLNSGLGYILGDEGSGSYFGKKLLAAFLYNQLNPAIQQEMQEELGLSREVILQNVYEKPHANVYLAGFTRFIASHQEEPYFRDMLVTGMKEFLRLHVCCYPAYREVPVHLVGSIAFHFQGAIRAAASELDIQVGQILQSPIRKLLEYHIANIFKTT